MVGIVPRSAKLMELTGLFSGKAKSLIGGGVGSLAFKSVSAGPCRGNVCPSWVLGLGPLVPGVWGIFFPSPETLSFTLPHTLWGSQEIQQSMSSRFRSRSVLKVVATGSETDFSVILKSCADLRS